MKKFLMVMLSCMGLCFGLISFAGCDTTQQIKNISVDKLPTKTSYVVGEQISLDGGVLNISYIGGKTSTIPLSIATPNIYKFDEAGEVTVTLNYKEKLTTINVLVNKRDIDITNVSIPHNIYNAEPLPIDIHSLIGVNIPSDATSIIEYKLKNSDKQFSNKAPIDAGIYTTNITIKGGAHFNDVTIKNKDYVIEKTSLNNLTNIKNNKYQLSYNLSDLGPIEYGTNIDFSKRWSILDEQGRNTYGEAPFPKNIQSLIKYEYQIKNTSQWIAMDYNPDNTITAALKPNEYLIKISLKNNKNIADYQNIYSLNIQQKKLTYRKDYQLRIFHKNNSYDISNNTEPTQFVYDGNCFELILINDIESNINNNQNNHLSLSQINYKKTNTNATNSLPPTDAGDYVIEYLIEGGEYYQDIHQTIEFRILQSIIDLPTYSEKEFQYREGIERAYPVGEFNLDKKLDYDITYALKLDDGTEPVFTKDLPQAKGTYIVKITYKFINARDANNYVLPQESITSLKII